MKLSRNLAEQKILEDILERTKPAVPAECRHLDWLLFSPFRYPARPSGSRFRRPAERAGVFYAAENVDTAAAEVSFYRLLFFAESPATPWPSNPLEHTAFQTSYAGEALDLTRPPLDADRTVWTHPTDYGACQQLADVAREADAAIIRFESVRDPQHRANVALLTCRAFTAPAPLSFQTWRIYLSSTGVRSACEFPKRSLEFDRPAFAADPRIAGMNWDR